MYTQAVLAAFFAVTAMGAPFDRESRQQSATDPLSCIEGLLSSLPTGTTGGLPALPSGTDPLSCLESLLPTGTGGGLLPLPSGGPLACLGSLIPGISPTGTTGGHPALPSGTDPLSCLQSLLPTGLSGGLPALPSGLLGSLGGSSSSGSGGNPLSGLTGLETSTTNARAVETGGVIDADVECKNVTVVFARGTTELPTLGEIVGPSLETALQSALNSDVSVQGVDYTADAAEIPAEAMDLGPGSQMMLDNVRSVLSSCPNTQVVLSGYSQGAMLVHNTMASLDQSEAANVKAVVTFGDPFVGMPIENFSSDNWKSFCGTGDMVCSEGTLTSQAHGGTSSDSMLGHLGYGSDTTTAADFVKGKVAI